MTQTEAAEKIIEQGGCRGVQCKDCPSGREINGNSGCCNHNEFFKGSSNASGGKASEAHLDAFRAFLGKSKKEPAKPVKPEIRLLVEIDSFLFSADDLDEEINGTIEQRDKLNRRLATLRKGRKVFK